MRGGNKRKTTRARQRRQVENEAEEMLWFELRGRHLNGYKFVRQLPIGPYFADFACREQNLVVEVDGSQHAGGSYDRTRDDTMKRNGWSVLRFWHADILRDRNGVLETIVAALDGRLTKPVVATDMRFVPRDVSVDAKPGNASAAPHPPFGHLLPVNGEKGGALP